MSGGSEQIAIRLDSDCNQIGLRLQSDCNQIGLRGHTRHSDALRCTQMHSGAIRCNQMQSKALSGTQRTFPAILDLDRLGLRACLRHDLGRRCHIGEEGRRRGQELRTTSELTMKSPSEGHQRPSKGHQRSTKGHQRPSKAIRGPSDGLSSAMPHLARLTDERAVELGARRAEPVEDGELPVELVAGDLDHRHLGVVGHLLEGLLPLGQRL